MKSAKSRNSMITAVALFMCTAAIACGMFFSQAMERAREQAYRSLADGAAEQLATLDAYTEGNFTILETLSRVASASGDPVSAMWAMEDMFKGAGFKESFIADDKGMAVTSDGRELDLAGRECFKSGMRGERGLEYIAKGRLSGRAIVAFSVPIERGGEIVGVALGGVDAESFRSLLTSNAYENAGYSFVCDSRGNVIIGAEDDSPDYISGSVLELIEEGERREAVADDLLNGRDGRVMLTVNGESRQSVYRTAAEADWRLFNAVPQSAVTAAARESFAVSALIIGAALLTLLIIMIYILARDRREQKKLVHERNELREKNEENTIVIDHSGKSVLRYYMKDGAMETEGPFFSRFGLGKRIEDFPESFIAAGAVMDESKEDLRSLYADMKEGVLRGGHNVRLMTRDEGTRWFHTDYTALRDERGRPYCAVVSIFDNTELLENELAYKKRLEELRVLLEGCVSYAECDLTGDTVERVEGFRCDYGCGKLEELPLTRFLALDSELNIHPDDRERFLAFCDRKRLLELFASGVSEERCEYRSRARGDMRWYASEIRMVRDPRSDGVKAFIIVTDVNAEHVEREKLEKLAYKDSLTDLLNRAATEQRIKDALARAGEEEQSAMIMVDLDFFKTVNDTLGHQAGDETLRRIALAISRSFRKEDILGRFGGDEFLAFIPRGATLQTVSRKSQDIVESLQFDIGGVSLSASIGVAMCRGGEKTFEKLYAEADSALYRAKAAGKGRYHISGLSGEVDGDAEGEICDIPASIQLKTLLENIDGGVLLAEVENENVRITYVSPSFYRSLGRTEKDTGAGGADALELVYPDDVPIVLSAARRSAKGEVTDCVYRDVGDQWRQLRIARLSEDAAGKATIIGVVTDITSIKRSEERLAISEERYRMATELSRALIWDVDIERRTLSQSEDMARLLGQKSVCYLNVPEGIIASGAVHPDSVANMRTMFKDMFAGRDDRDYTLQLMTENDGVWVKAAFHILRDAAGRPARAVGVLERTPNVNADMLSFRDELRFMDITSGSLLCAVCADLSRGRVERCSPTPEDGRAIEEYEAFRERLRDSAAPEFEEGIYKLTDRENLIKCYGEGNTWLFREYRRKNGQWVSMAANLLRHPVSGDVYVFGYFRDITSRHEWTLAVPNTERDSVTTLYNAAALREIAVHVMDSSEPGSRFAVTIFELGGFDTLKSEKGYQAAQRLLFNFGRLCRIVIGGPVAVGHIHEQRFAIFRADCGGTDEQRRVAEQCRQRMALLLRQTMPDVDFSIACGFAADTREAADYDELTRRANIACASSCSCPGRPVTSYVEPGTIPGECRTASSAGEGRPRILVADDDRMTRKILSAVLSRFYDTDTAENGVEALEKLRCVEYDLVISDIIMPVKSGFDVLAEMRADKSLSDIPVVIINADTESESEIKALTMGAADVVMKPFVTKTLLSRVSNIIGKRQAARVAEQNRIYELRFQQQANLIEIAEHDELTGIYNRRAFYSRVRERLAHSGERYLIIRFDIDNFKVLNDALGVETGDRLLREIAAALRETCGSEELYARLEADHFGVFRPEAGFDADRAFERLRKWFAEYPIDFRLMCRMGVYVIEDPSVDVGIMCDRALLALRSTKGSFAAKPAVYDDELREKLVEEQELAGDMAAALENGQFKVFFQPQYDYDSGSMIGAEALVRWQHPRRGMIGPEKFIPLFERNGFISVMDEYVWERSCRYMSEWKERKNKLLPVSVSVNISRIDIYNPRLIEKLTALVEKYSLPSSCLRLEITESAYMQDPALLTETVKGLRAAGFSVEIDDFGSGYSSLTTLKDVPADLLKLDMRFLSSGEDASRGGSILSSVIRMAHWLKLPIIAEGVETREQADYLKSLGCYYMQGYFFGRPMPAEEFERLMDRAVIGRMDRYEKVDLTGMATFWDPSAQSELLFNSIMGGAAIMEYTKGHVELLRANDGFFTELGVTRADFSPYVTDVLAFFEESSRAVFSSMVEEAEKNRSVARGRLTRADGNGEGRSVLSRVRVLAENNGGSLLYVSVEDVTQLP